MQNRFSIDCSGRIQQTKGPPGCCCFALFLPQGRLVRPLWPPRLCYGKNIKKRSVLYCCRGHTQRKKLEISDEIEKKRNNLSHQQTTIFSLSLSLRVFLSPGFVFFCLHSGICFLLLRRLVSFSGKSLRLLGILQCFLSGLEHPLCLVHNFWAGDGLIFFMDPKQNRKINHGPKTKSRTKKKNTQTKS